jgi:hypothetical protein
LLKASLERLSDASHLPLLQTLETRLRRAGLFDTANRRRLHGRRALAHRTFTEERSGTLADQESSERIERAIQERRRVWLRHLPDPVTPEQRGRGDDGRFRAWPLQLLFHNISWYLAFEVDVGFPQNHGQVNRRHAMTLRLSTDDQSNQDKAPVHGAAEAGSD